MSEHIIRVNSPAEHIELERRQHQRRREDQARTIEQGAEMLARERSYAILQAAATLGATPLHKDPVKTAMLYLAKIEDELKKETEEQRKESK